MSDVLIKRELLEQAASMELDTTARSIRIQDELRAALAQSERVADARAFKDELLDATTALMHPHIEGVFAVFMQKAAAPSPSKQGEA